VIPSPFAQKMQPFPDNDEDLYMIITPLTIDESRQVKAFTDRFIWDFLTVPIQLFEDLAVTKKINVTDYAFSPHLKWYFVIDSRLAAI
jgi:hypothetical protein